MKSDMASKIVPMKGVIRTCPFCGQEFNHYTDSWVSRDDKDMCLKYYMHPIGAKPCLLEDMCEGFTIGAGDSHIERGWIGEYAQKWNECIDRYNQKMINQGKSEILDTVIEMLKEHYRIFKSVPGITYLVDMLEELKEEIDNGQAED